MNDQITTLKDDLAFVRAMAQDIDKPNSRGGLILISAGTLFGAASLVHWSIASQLIKAPLAIVNYVWLGAIVAFWLALYLVLRGPKPGQSRAGKAVNMAWSSVGWALFNLAICAVAVAWRTQSNAVLLLFPAIVLSLYGAAWSVAAAVSGKRWMGLAAAAAFVLAIGTALVCNQPAVYLLYTVALTLTATLPGVVMLRQARAAQA